ncbi:DUF302 domain-containing protein [Persicimonas caeni]|uniref:DUF302 domain-containing protein n=1 Tax=Persicimonas caeni TaxID=2292766 RepID=A0A4Y6PQ86_PERCE|nr:DUF302 domain-containing protein [Persicimonas caeni]QDG50269.1 DUF302 domain-containing protein [Persicimonas caeni]QED31490.1 DUF302 domain-containing protein [Persicimonas caeni]
MSYFGDPNYGITTTLEGVGFDEAVERTTAALKEESFGVLTSIDIKETLKKKLDAEHRNYVILGACNPPLAHQALTAEAPIGLLLPCNVVVTEDDDGNAVVSAIDPVEMFNVVGRDDIQPIAQDVKERLERVVASLAS